MNDPTTQPGVKSRRELLAILEADHDRFWELGELWSDLSEEQQRELVATAHAMLNRPDVVLADGTRIDFKTYPKGT